MDVERDLQEAAKHVLGEEIDQPTLVLIMNIAREAAKGISAQEMALLRKDKDDRERIFKDFHRVLLPFMNLNIGPEDKIVSLGIQGPDGEVRVVSL